MMPKHHERFNGSGYPSGIFGDDILPETRILTVSDVVEAMATYRPYLPALGINEAIRKIIDNRGILFDPDVVDACVRLFSRKGFAWEEENTKVSMKFPAELPFQRAGSL
jgi:HD-GYP domain-containing protein (c-di-GMP phosphodiesterase class II)